MQIIKRCKAIYIYISMYAVHLSMMQDTIPDLPLYIINAGCSYTIAYLVN